MQVLVVAVSLADLAAQSVDRQVHGAEAHRLVDAFLAVDRDLLFGVVPMVLDESSRLDEHAARTAGGVEDAAAEGLDDLDDQLDQRGRGEELAAFVSLAHGEVAQEILVDLAEGVAFDVHRHRGEELQQFDQRGVLQHVVGARQHAGEVFVFGFDGPHGVVQCAADVLAFRQIEQVAIARLLGGRYITPRAW